MTRRASSRPKLASNPASAQLPRSPIMAGLLLALAAALWSGNHVLARAVSASVPIWSLNFVRWIIVAALMALVAAPQLRDDWPEMRRHMVVLGLLGILGGGLFGALQFVGVRYTGALTLSVLNSVAPAFIALASFLIFRDAIAPLQCIGIAISLGGVLAIVAKLDPATLLLMSFNPGDLIIAFNMGVWAVYSACLRLKPPIAATSFLFSLAVWAAITALPGAVQEFVDGDYLKPDQMTLATLAYSSVLSSALAYIFWGSGVETLGVNRAGAFLHLVPVFGALLATTLLGEQLGLHHVAGIGLILMGVTLAVRKPGQRGTASARARARRANAEGQRSSALSATPRV
jgi:drug/metabolite transporter (DMT)-like permease